MSGKLALPYLAVICTTVLWASAFVLIKPLVSIMPASNLAILRYGLAAIIITVLYGLYRNKSKAPLSIKCYAFLIGFIGIGVYNLALNTAEVSITAATTAFMICGLGPCISVLLSVMFLSERLSKRMLCGIAVSLCGLALMTWHHWGYSSVWGLGYALIAAACGGAFSVLQKPILHKLKPFEVMTFAILGGFIFVLFFGHDVISTLQSMTWHMAWQVLYLAVFPAIIAYSLWGYGIKHIPISQAVSVLYLLPVVTAIMAWALNHIIPPVEDIIGGVIILCGAILTKGKAPTKVRSHDAMERVQSET